jgi:hypothetical protein
VELVNNMLSGGSTQVQASCPSGYKAIGGGYSSNSSTVVAYAASVNFASNLYEVTFVNLGTTTTSPTLEADVYCAQFTQ